MHTKYNVCFLGLCFPKHCSCKSFKARSIPRNTTWNSYFKLVRTPLNVLLRGFLNYLSLSLYAHINSDKCHAWFDFNAASLVARNTEQVNITKKSCPR